MLTRRQIIKSSAIAGLGLLPMPLWRSPAEAMDSNAAGFDLPGINTHYLANGAPFAPFFVKFAKDNALENVWSSDRGDQQATFWKVHGHAVGNRRFLPLGDAISVNDAGRESIAALLLAPDDANPGVLSHPLRFDWISDDHGSGNSRDISYFQPVPPDGYTALGICVSVNDSNVGNYWCVRNDYLRVLSQKTNVWTDSGQRWESHDGSVDHAGLTDSDVAPPGQMFLLPNTMIAAESSLQPTALIMKKCAVDSVKWLAAGDPPYDPSVSQGDKSSPGISRVMVVPCTAVSDPSLRNRATASPFYYMVNRPVWVCTETSSTPEGEEIEVTFTIGTSETDSSEFRRQTSWNISSSVGVEEGGVSANVSVSFTQEFALTTAHSATSSTSTEVKHTFHAPRQPITQFWQLYSRISIFRGSGALLSSAEYGKTDYRMLPTPAQTRG
jgi:hypothetical protein